MSLSPSHEYVCARSVAAHRRWMSCAGGTVLLLAWSMAAPVAWAQGAPECGQDYCGRAGCIFNGILNTPINDARMDLTPYCRLGIVPNESGTSGFEEKNFPLNAPFIMTAFEKKNWANARETSSVEFDVFGQTPAVIADAQGSLERLIGVVKIVPSGSEPGVSDILFDFSNVGASAFEITIRSRGEVVGAERSMHPAVMFKNTDIRSITSYIEGGVVAGASVSYGIAIGLAETTPIRTEDGTSAEGDTVVVRTLDARLILNTHSRLQKLVTVLPPFEIIFEYAGPGPSGRCLDRDGDGFGSPGDPTCSGGPLPDCNDELPLVHPGAPERCNFMDDNCNGPIDEGYDQDGDGYRICQADCNDHNPQVHPQAPELCNGIDDDCDGQRDETFFLVRFQLTPDQKGLEEVHIPVGDPCSIGEGECEVVGIVSCPPPGISGNAICVGSPTPSGVEGPVGADNCFDGRDNDCDDLLDHKDPDCVGPEVCDGFDNNNNGAIDELWLRQLGLPCAVGVGLCRSQGVMVCSPDGSGIECSAQPNPPGIEGPPGSFKCGDGQDNDCDGLTDCRTATGGPGGDPDCREAEKCDGVDNDCDFQVDEDFAAFLGQPCARGLGACRRTGEIVCRPDGTGVKCNAVPLPGFYEGPGDCSCTDGIDNDCDLLTDEADPNCSSGMLRARCSLEACNPHAGDECYSGHRVAFDYTGGLPGATVTAELLALKEDGSELAALPVNNGDIAQLASRKTGFGFAAESNDVTLNLARFDEWEVCETGPDKPPYLAKCEIFDDDCDADVDLKDHAAFQNNFGQTRRVHTVFSPIPLLRVRVDDGQNEAVAYCSNTPYLDVTKPDPSVVISESEGDITNVTAAIPLVDPASLAMKIDGVNVFPLMGVNPASDFPGGPYTGSFTLSAPGCQSRRHVEVCSLFVETADIGSLSPNVLRATIRGLGGGGHRVVVDGNMLPGSYPNPPAARCLVDDVLDSGVSHEIGVEITRPHEGEITIGPPTGVLAKACHGRELADMHLNGKLYSASTQVLVPGDGVSTADTWVLNLQTALNQADLHDELVLGMPPVAGELDPGMNRLIAQATDLEFNSSFDSVFFAVGPVISNPTFTVSTAAIQQELGDVAAELVVTKVENAFTLGMKGAALTTFFGELCNSIGPDLATDLDERLTGYKSDPKNVHTPWPLCDVPNVRMKITSVDIDPTAFACEITPLMDKIRLKITLPEFSASTHFSGDCEVTGPFDICVVEVIVDTDAEFHVPAISVTFEITESVIMNQKLMDDLAFDLGPDPYVISGSINDNSEINCIVGTILDIFNFLLEVITLGFWDPGLGEFEFELTDDKLKEKLGEKNGDMREFGVFKFDNEDMISEYSMKLSAELGNVQITPDGIAAAITASFEATETDPEVADIPGTPLSLAPMPQPPIPGADEVTVALSDDVFNQLLSGLAQSGKLKTLFEDVRVLGDFLPDPATCASLGAILEPRCVGLLGGDCNQFVLASRREVCEEAKQKMADRLLAPGTAVILHGRVDVPPKIQILDNGATTDKVEVRLRFSQISVALLVDRDGDGVLSGNIASLPPCFGPSPDTIHECALWEACLNVNVDAQLFIPPGQLLLRLQVLNVAHDLSTGTVCGGGIDDGDDYALIEESAQGATLDKLNERLRNSTPDLKTKGLDFGGLVSFEGAKLIAIENDGSPEFQDYIAITGKLVVPPPN